MGYLFDYKEDGLTTSAINSTLSRRGFRVDAKRTIISQLSISSCLFIDSDHGRFFLSEFPGNCSAIIVSEIQYRTKDVREQMIKAAIDIAHELDYALLFASGTSKDLKDQLKELKFEEVLNNVFNPHSGSRNYFMVYRTGISYE